MKRHVDCSNRIGFPSSEFIPSLLDVVPHLDDPIESYFCLLEVITKLLSAIDELSAIVVSM